MNGGGQRRTALVLYGTETGNAQDLAEEVGRVTERFRFVTRVAELDDVPATALLSYTITIFVISTTGQGDFPSNARGFWTSLLKKKLSATFLHDVSYVLVGLGDTSYPKFNWAARKFDKRLKQLGACEYIDPCEADEQGEDSTDGAFLAWLPSFKAALLKNFPIPDGLLQIPDEQPLPSKWLLERTSVLANGDLNGALITTENGDSIGKGTSSNRGHSIGEADHDSRPIPDSFQVVLEENRRVTPQSHWQDVRLLTLTTDQGIDYLPGDALSILPKNFPEDVTALIELMNWTSVADVPITFSPTASPTNPSNYPPCPIPFLFSHTISYPLTLRTLLTSYLDITAVPRRSLFTTLSRYTSDPTQRGRLLEFTAQQYLDEYYDYATRPRRSILEILQEFDSVKIPWQEAANVFPVLRGRQFSIASGGNLKRVDGGKGGKTRLELLVAIVKYKTVIKKIRQGVCTRYLANLAPGSTLNVVHRTEGRFFPQAKQRGSTVSTTEDTPKLLIGAGTGVAPLRALIMEDEHRAQKLGRRAPTTTLIFGSRNEDKDFFFADEWAARIATQNHRQGDIGHKDHDQNPSLPHSPNSDMNGDSDSFKLITSFSRDQPTKFYIQDRIREHAELVFGMIVKQGATVVVCGSSGAMPKAVRAALVDVLVDQGCKREEGGREGEEGGKGDAREERDAKGNEEWTREKAEQYLDVLEKGRRYLQETW